MISLTNKKIVELNKIAEHSTIYVAPSYICNGHLLIHKRFISNAEDFMEGGAFSERLLKTASDGRFNFAVAKSDAEIEEKVIGDLSLYRKVYRTRIQINIHPDKASEAVGIWLTGDENPPRAFAAFNKNIMFAEKYLPDTLSGFNRQIGRIRSVKDEDTGKETLEFDWLSLCANPRMLKEAYSEVESLKKAMDVEFPELVKADEPEAEEDDEDFLS